METFARIMHTYEAGRGIASIHQVCLVRQVSPLCHLIPNPLQILLRAIPTAGFATLDSIIYTVMRHLDVWAAMDCLDSLSAAIFDRYFGLADDGVKPKHQSPMCWELAHKAHLMNKHANIIRDWLTQEPHVSWMHSIPDMAIEIFISRHSPQLRQIPRLKPFPPCRAYIKKAT